jgi:hypothetical protein
MPSPSEGIFNVVHAGLIPSSVNNDESNGDARDCSSQRITLETRSPNPGRELLCLSQRNSGPHTIYRGRGTKRLQFEHARQNIRQKTRADSSFPKVRSSADSIYSCVALMTTKNTSSSHGKVCSRSGSRSWPTQTCSCRLCSPCSVPTMSACPTCIRQGLSRHCYRIRYQAKLPWLDRQYPRDSISHSTKRRNSECRIFWSITGLK